MFLVRFLRLNSRQCLGLLLVVLLANQEATAKLANRRKYESHFEALFEDAKTVLEQGGMMHTVQHINSMMVVNDGNKAVKQTMAGIVKFAKANPDKIGVAAGLAASSWLLYHSIVLGNEIQGFFNEIKELKDEFNKYYMYKVPKLDEMFLKIKDLTGNEEQQKAFYKELYKELMSYYRDLQCILDRVDDIMADFNKAQMDATINTIASGAIAILSATALVVAGPVTLAPVMWKSSLVATLVCSSVSGTLSEECSRLGEGCNPTEGSEIGYEGSEKSCVHQDDGFCLLETLSTKNERLYHHRIQT